MTGSEFQDGGWGWMVVFSAFITYVLVDGIKYSFGIILIELLDTFKRSHSETSLILSLQLGGYLITGKSKLKKCNLFALNNTVNSVSF